MGAQFIISLVIALGAAVRGNWSPCGESLQAQIHPMGEKSRGNTWGVTITAFTIASMAAGAALTASFGLIGSFLSVDSDLALILTAILGVTAGALDLSPLKPPTPRRQVNENWIGRYRGWVYGAAFGIQLGIGFAVFVMSWGYYAMLLAAMLSGSVAVAAIIGATFGLGRGILLMLGRWNSSPDRLLRFHNSMARLKKPVFTATGTAMIAVGVLGLF